VKDIRRAIRKQYSAEEKIRIVLDGLRGEHSIAELCRREGIAESLYYTWSKEFLEAGKRRLAGDTTRAATTPGRASMWSRPSTRAQGHRRGEDWDGPSLQSALVQRRFAARLKPRVAWQGAYRAVFSIVSAVAIVWLVVAYKGAPYVATWGIPEWWKPIAELFPFPPIGVRGSTIIG
jgi:transposase-like protein